MGGLLLLAVLGPAAHAQQSVTLIWDPSPGTNIAGYVLKYGTSSGSYPNSINVGNTLTYTVSGLASGVTYYFIAMARDTRGAESVPSNVVSWRGGGGNANQPMRYLWSEAERGALVTPITTASDATASGGQYISTTVTDQGTLSIQFNVTEPDTYVVWCRVRSRDGNFDSFYVSMDGQAEDVYDTAQDRWADTWQWTQVNGRAGGLPLTVNPRLFNLTAGNHNLVLRGREPGTALDRILITNDRGFVPQGFGTNPPVNAAPTLNALSNLTLNEDAGPQTVQLSGIGSGAASENQPITVAAASSNTGLLPHPAVSYTSANSTGSLAFTPVANASGSATVTVTVNDGQTVNNLVTRSFAVTVNPVNDPPTLNPLSNLTLNQNAPEQVVTLQGIGSGAANEADTLTVTATSSNPSLIPTPTVSYVSLSATGTLRFRPNANAAGSAVITVTVNDNRTVNNLVSRSFTVTVNAVNSPPTISSSGSRTTAEDTLLAVPFTVSDPDTPVQMLTVTARTSNTALVPNANLLIDGSGTSRTLRVLPGTNQSGTVTIYLTVRDPQGLTATTSFPLTIQAQNDPPTVNPIPDRVINQNAPDFTVSVTGINSGAANEGQNLTVTTSTSNKDLIPNPSVSYSSPNSTATLTFNPDNSRTGTATITVTVRDSQGATAVQQFTIFVKNSSNNLPNISTIPDQTITKNTSTADIPFTISDSATSASQLTLLRYSSNPTLIPTNNIVFGGSGNNRTVRLTPAANQTGTATITITVVDGGYGATNRSFLLTVTAANTPPTISSMPDLTATLGVPLGPLAFNIYDVESPASELIVTAKSSDQLFLPDTNLLLGGNGSERALFILPPLIPSASATITLTVSDGSASASTFIPLSSGPVLRIARSGVGLSLTWSDPNARLQQADRPSGPWSDVSPAPSSPYSVSPSGGMKVYRLRR